MIAWLDELGEDIGSQDQALRFLFRVITLQLSRTHPMGSRRGSACVPALCSPGRAGGETLTQSSSNGDCGSRQS